jgi:thioredoxin-like negative regulator of GroEL
VRTVAEKLAGRAAVILVNTEENPTLATRFGVRSIPIIMLLQQGKVVAQLPGANSTEAVLAWFRRHLPGGTL